MNTVIQIKQWIWNCWLFPWLRIAEMQTGRRRLTWTARVGGIWPALAAINIPVSTTGDISVAPTAGTLLTEVNCEDGGRCHVLAGVRGWAQKSVRNSWGYAISEYILTDIFCVEKWWDRVEAYAITEDTL